MANLSAPRKAVVMGRDSTLTALTLLLALCGVFALLGTLSGVE